MQIQNSGENFLYKNVYVNVSINAKFPLLQIFFQIKILRKLYNAKVKGLYSTTYVLFSGQSHAVLLVFSCSLKSLDKGHLYINQ